MELLRANVARLDGRLVATLNHFQRASELFKEIGNMREATLTLGNLGNGYGELGLLSEAEAALRSVLEIALKRGLNYLLGGVYQLLCNVMAYQGRLAEAREAGLRSAAISSEQSDYRFQGSALLYLSITEFLAADFVQSEIYGRQAMQHFEGVPALQPFAMAMVARALLGQSRLSEAKDYATTAYRQLELLGGLEDGEVYVRIAYIETLLMTGDESSGRLVLADALRVVREKAATIEEPAWKNSFLQALPENNRLFELARRFGIDPNLD
jgi:eukaryotic-like serine/threonine-protein kinase